MTIAKPPASEHPAYMRPYIDRVPEDGDVLYTLKATVSVLRQTVAMLPQAWLTRPFAEGEWTVKEILLHIMDSERVFSYRALRIARGDSTVLPGFDHDAYVPMSGANDRSLESIWDEYAAIRASSLALYRSFDEAALLRIGSANHNPLSVRAAIYVTAGHELHHLASIQENYRGRAE